MENRRIKTPEVHRYLRIQRQFFWLLVIIAKDLAVFLGNIQALCNRNQVTIAIYLANAPVYSTIVGQCFQQFISDDGIGISVHIFGKNL